MSFPPGVNKRGLYGVLGLCSTRPISTATCTVTCTGNLQATCCTGSLTRKRHHSIHCTGTTCTSTISNRQGPSCTGTNILLVLPACEQREYKYNSCNQTHETSLHQPCRNCALCLHDSDIVLVRRMCVQGLVEH
ncbi:hypothetical protein COO60DRAFT_662308 [Scenedesmus sp. NREL 46B-D3]|nr:hypothetical protein COO60DRAFT_662308 [Scenedesmus sp. NREL 46B-D3]